MSDLSDDAIRAHFANISDLEDARDSAQTDLKNAWGAIRDAHGKQFADSFKLAVKRARMDYDKRQAADDRDAEADRLFVLLTDPSRVARGARTREGGEVTTPDAKVSAALAPKTGSEVTAPEHDAETGEIIESQAAMPAQTVPAAMPEEMNDRDREAAAYARRVLPHLSAPELASVESSGNQSTAPGKDRGDNSTDGGACAEPIDPAAAKTLPAGIKPRPSILTFEVLDELFSYDPKTGFVMWKVDAGTSSAGDRAGSKRASGYRMIQIDGHRYQEHRIAWVLANGELPTNGLQIDHKNQIKDDNRLANLRAATPAQQQINSAIQKNNRHGRGVSWRADRSKWRAEIYVNGERIGLGHFDHQEDAQAAYEDAAREHYGDFAQAPPVDTHSEPVPAADLPAATVADARSAVPPSAAPGVSNITPFRTHNPETHFLNSKGLLRLHGCLNAEVCGSEQPRSKLCFSCSVSHDGPTYQGGDAA